jgi:hypothetical protein
VDEPVTGAPAGAAAGPADPDDLRYPPGSATVSSSADRPGPASGPGGPAGSATNPNSPAGPSDSGRPSGRTGATAAGPGAGRGARGGLLRWLRGAGKDSAGPAGAGTPGTSPSQESVRLRRRRRWFIAGIAAGAALIVVALCAGTVALVSAVSGLQDSTDEVRAARDLRDGACLRLEQRLNRLVPPGSAGTPQGRAIAVRDENAALRIYVDEVRDDRSQDGWRQLLDARTTYAEALDVQAKSRTPAFYVPPRAPDGLAVTDLLVDRSPSSCAGAIRRLAVPDL